MAFKRIEMNKRGWKARQSLRKTLTVLCGPSRSGKSFYAQELKRKYSATVISSDVIREKLTGRLEPGDGEADVWDMFDFLKCRALVENDHVVLDACHITPQARWHALKDANGCRKICVLFDIPLAIVLKRNKQDWARKMWQDFQVAKPTKKQLLSEGFDEVKIVKHRV